MAQGATKVKVPDRDSLWSVEGSPTLTPSTPVTLTWDNGEGLVFKRTVSVDDEYLFKIVDAVENRGSAPVSLAPYARIHRYGTPKVLKYWILHEGLIGVIGEQGEQKSKYSTALEDGTQTFPIATGGWLGFTDKYWAATLVPDQKAPYRAQFTGHEPKLPTEQPAYQTDYLRDAVDHSAGRDPQHRRPPLRRRQGGQAAAALRGGPRHQAVRSADRLGLVLLHHQAALLSDGGHQLRTCTTSASPSSF